MPNAVRQTIWWPVTCLVTILGAIGYALFLFVLTVWLSFFSFLGFEETNPLPVILGLIGTLLVASGVWFLFLSQEFPSLSRRGRWMLCVLGMIVGSAGAMVYPSWTLFWPLVLLALFLLLARLLDPRTSLITRSPDGL